MSGSVGANVCLCFEHIYEQAAHEKERWEHVLRRWVREAQPYSRFTVTASRSSHRCPAMLFTYLMTGTIRGVLGTVHCTEHLPFIWPSLRKPPARGPICGPWNRGPVERRLWRPGSRGMLGQGRPAGCLPRGLPWGRNLLASKVGFPASGVQELNLISLCVGNKLPGR